MNKKTEPEKNSQNYENSEKKQCKFDAWTSDAKGKYGRLCQHEAKMDAQIEDVSYFFEKMRKYMFTHLYAYAKYWNLGLNYVLFNGY